MRCPSDDSRIRRVFESRAVRYRDSRCDPQQRAREVVLCGGGSERAIHDDSVRGNIRTFGVFSNGIDARPGGCIQVREFVFLLRKTFSDVESLPMPTIAAINGKVHSLPSQSSIFSERRLKISQVVEKYLFSSNRIRSRWRGGTCVELRLPDRRTQDGSGSSRNISGDHSRRGRNPTVTSSHRSREGQRTYFHL